MATNGIYGNGIIGSGFDDMLAIPIVGWDFVFKWKSLETSEGVFNQSYLDNQINLAINAGIKVSFKIWVAGPNVNATPDWLYTNGVEQVVMQTSGDVYPYYQNTYYKARYQILLDYIVTYLSNLDEAVLSQIVSYQITIGTTGDAVPYHGVPVNSLYLISDSDWLTYQRFYQSYMYNAMQDAGLPVQLVINPANDGSNVQWGINNLPFCGFKAGDLSHNYSWPGEYNYDSYFIGLIGTGRFVNGEAANPNWGEPSWLESPDQNTFALLCSCLHANFVRLNLPYGIFVANTNNNDAYQFFNKYADNNINKTKGFCQLRDQIDLADTTRFPENIYENVINPAQQTNYNNAYNNIIAQGYPLAQQQTEITKITVIFLNPARISNIRLATSSASYLPVDRSRDGDAYNNDYIVDGLPDNYYQYIVQYSPNTTSLGAWRVGDTAQIYGRYCRIPDDEMFFSIDTVLVSEGSWTLTIDIVYYDEGTDTWDLWYSNGTSKVSAGTITKTDTNTFIKQSFTITDFNGGGLLENNTDFSITGNTTKFTLLEVSDITNNDMALTPNFSASQTIGIPTNVNLTDTSTGSDGAITQRRVYLQQADGTYLVPTGTTTSYVLWNIGDASISINCLTQDTALSILVQWLNVSNVVLYSKSLAADFSLYNDQFSFNLTLSQATPVPNVNITSNIAYLTSRMQYYIFLLNAQNAIAFASDTYTAQSNLSSATYMQTNAQFFF